MSSNDQRITIRRISLRLIVLGLITFLIASSTYSCRDKSSIGPDTTDNPTGSWVIHVSHDGVHIGTENDTISVRVYSPEGQLTGNVIVQSSNVADSLHVSPSVTTTTNIQERPWGTTIPLVYWGSNTTDLLDTITCKAIYNGIEVADTSTIISLINNF